MNENHSFPIRSIFSFGMCTHILTTWFFTGCFCFLNQKFQITNLLRTKKGAFPLYNNKIYTPLLLQENGLVYRACLLLLYWLQTAAKLQLESSPAFSTPYLETNKHLADDWCTVFTEKRRNMSQTMLVLLVWQEMNVDAINRASKCIGEERKLPNVPVYNFIGKIKKRFSIN